MILEQILINIAELYYPKGVCSLNNYDKYIQSSETYNLRKHSSKLLENKKIRKAILSKFKEHEQLLDIEDVSAESFDRCLTYKIEFIENNQLYRLCIYISSIVPFYSIEVTKNEISLDPYRWITNPKRNKEAESKTFKKQINLLSKIIEKEICYKMFPENLKNKVLSNISYADIGIGNFTFFNAFFLKQ